MRAGQGIIVISITLLMLGVVMVNSASMQISEHYLTATEMLMSTASTSNQNISHVRWQ